MTEQPDLPSGIHAPSPAPAIIRWLEKRPRRLGSLITAIGTGLLTGGIAFLFSGPIEAFFGFEAAGAVASGLGYFMGKVLDDREGLVKGRLETDNKNLRGQLMRAHNDICRKDEEAEYMVKQARVDEQESASEALALQLQEITLAILEVANRLDGVRVNADKSRVFKEAYSNILTIVRKEIGPPGGVRACIFTVDKDRETLSCAKAVGRDDGGSSRTFSPGWVTYEKALRRQHHFVDNIKEDEESRKNLLSNPLIKPAYETFCTWPVGIEGKLLGILTIDAPNPGDLTNDDLEKLRVFAATFATILAADSNCHAIDTTTITPESSQYGTMSDKESVD